MKNLKVTEYINPTKIALTGLTMASMIVCTGCAAKTKANNTTTIPQKITPTRVQTIIKEGILTIGDEIFLIEYSMCHSNDVYDDEIIIYLMDGTTIITTRNNFYEYDRNSETMNQIKQLIIEKDHIIK